MALHTRPITSELGVEVLGLDLDGEISSSVAADLYDLWLRYGVVLLRNADITPLKLIELAEVFGEIELHPFESLRVEGLKQLLWLSNENQEVTPVFYKNGKPLNYILTWHTDLMYQEVPSKGSLIRAITVPPEGGETGLINTANVYRALPAALKERIDGREMLFTFRTDPSSGPFGDTELSGTVAEDSAKQKAYFPDLPDTIHPLVLTHPETGEKTLNVSPYNAVRILGMPQDESGDLLRELVAFATQLEFQYFHRWRPDDVLIFDNQKTMHSVKGVPPHFSRVMQRATLRGTVKTGRFATGDQALEMSA